MCDEALDVERHTSGEASGGLARRVRSQRTVGPIGTGITITQTGRCEGLSEMERTLKLGYTSSEIPFTFSDRANNLALEAARWRASVERVVRVAQAAAAWHVRRRRARVVRPLPLGALVWLRGPWPLRAQAPTWF